MIGNLFKGALSTLGQSASPDQSHAHDIDSVQEDIHTRSLLFPEASSLPSHGQEQLVPLPSGDIQVYRSTTSHDFNPDIELSTKDIRILLLQDRTISTEHTVLYDSHASNEVEPRPMSDYTVDIQTVANCMFGHSDVHAYKGVGWKIHRLPSDVKISVSPVSPYSDGRTSLGRASLKSSKLAQSYTTTTPPSFLSQKSTERKKVLITRMFPVDLDDIVPSTAEQDHPRSQVRRDEITAPMADLPRNFRIPLFALGLIITLPVQRGNVIRELPEPHILGEQHESVQSSIGSMRYTVWRTLEDRAGMDSSDPPEVNESDDPFDLITRRWDIVQRAVFSVQSVAEAEIWNLLHSSTSTTAVPSRNAHKARAASVSLGGKRVPDVSTHKPLQPTVQALHLYSGALARNTSFIQAVDRSRLRIADGVKVLRIRTRQGRWGIWRDEVRWLQRWAQDQKVVLDIFLTAGLAMHTKWLHALGPPYYRKLQQQTWHTGAEEEETPHRRTIVISPDKMVGRRLVFLLSAFLSSTQRQSALLLRPYQQTTPLSTSRGAYSQSPPRSMMFGKQESLRRQPKHPSKQFSSRATSLRSQSFTQHYRGPSDVMASFPMLGREISAAKSSIADMKTTVATSPTAHLSLRRRSVRGTGLALRPGSSGSVATDDLLRTLRHGDSSGTYSSASTDSQSAPRWGSMSSWTGRMGFWNNRRGSSSTEPTVEEEPVKSKLSLMVEEARRSEINVTQSALHDAPGVVDSPARAVPYESPIKSSVHAEDGVVDVEVTIPDFMSAFGSVVSSPSNSGFLSHSDAGIDGFDTFPRGIDEVPENVAGYLSRFHPDFVLQALPPNDDFEDNLKTAMRAELGNKSEVNCGTSWVDFSSAVIFDTRNMVVRNLRYQCRKVIPQDVATTTSGNSRDLLLVEPSRISIPPMGFVDTRFVDENITSFDAKLKDAVDEVTALPTALHTPISRHGDRRFTGGNTVSGHTINSRYAAADEPRTNAIRIGSKPEVTRGECKRIVLGALGDIAKEVCEDLQSGSELSQTAEGIPGLDERICHRKVGEKHEHENLLRQAVSTWLASLEEAV